MADDKSKKGYQDRSKVSILEKHEREYWCEKWNISLQQLVGAIRATGSHGIKEIEKYLQKKGVI